jgi:hypothetical protein
MYLPARLAAIPAMAALLLPVGLAATACAASPSCAGQCSPPYLLAVDFQPGITKPQASKVMKDCAGPTVRWVGKPRPRYSGPLHAIIYTKTLHAQSEVLLLTCLRHSPAVQTAGYGD